MPNPITPATSSTDPAQYRREGLFGTWPNQIFAVSLHHSILEGDRARQIVDVVERELLTPLGLRSLSPNDPAYRPRYEGGVWSRDSAYHQGAVWPWLIGPIGDSCDSEMLSLRGVAQAVVTFRQTTKDRDRNSR